MSKMKSIRNDRGFTQKFVSENSGVNLRLLQNYEQGTCNIDGASVDKLLNLSIVLNCKISDLIEDDYKSSMLRKAGY